MMLYIVIKSRFLNLNTYVSLIYPLDKKNCYFCV